MTALALFAAAAAGCVSIPAPGDEITAGDLALQVPAFAAATPSAVAGYAPLPGVRRVFGVIELRRLAARFGVPGEAPIEGDVCVERATVELEPARLLEAMLRTLPEARIEIKEYSRHRAPAGEIEFPRGSLQPSGLWTGSVRYGNRRRFAIWARVALQVSRTEVVAAEALLPGKPIAAGQVKLETVEGLPGARPAARSLEEVVGLTPRRPIAKGAAVMRTSLAEPPEIGRGDTVRVEVRQGSARLELEAKAEGDGRRGEKIILRNPESKRRFTARVEGKGRAVVESGGTR